jgi:hypothetical protein
MFTRGMQRGGPAAAKLLKQGSGLLQGAQTLSHMATGVRHAPLEQVEADAEKTIFEGGSNTADAHQAQAPVGVPQEGAAEHEGPVEAGAEESDIDEEDLALLQDRQPDQERTIFSGGKSVPDRHISFGFDTPQAPFEQQPGAENEIEAPAAKPNSANSENAPPRAEDVVPPKQQRRENSKERRGAGNKSSATRSTEMDDLAAGSERRINMPIFKSEEIRQEIAAAERTKKALFPLRWWSISLQEEKIRGLEKRLADALAFENMEALLTSQINELEKSDAEKIQSLKDELKTEGKPERAAFVQDYLDFCAEKGVTPSLEGLARYTTKIVVNLRETIRGLKNQLAAANDRISQLGDDLQAERDDHGQTKANLAIGLKEIEQLKLDRDEATAEREQMKKDRDEARAEREQMKKDHKAEMEDLRSMIKDLQQVAPAAVPARKTGVDITSTKPPKHNLPAEVTQALQGPRLAPINPNAIPSPTASPLLSSGSTSPASFSAEDMLPPDVDVATVVREYDFCDSDSEHSTPSRT